MPRSIGAGVAAQYPMQLGVVSQTGEQRTGRRVRIGHNPRVFPTSPIRKGRPSSGPAPSDKSSRPIGWRDVFAAQFAEFDASSQRGQGMTTKPA